VTGPTLVAQPFNGWAPIWQWTLGSGETGTAVVVPDKAEKTIHVFGTFGGNVSVEGSLETDVATAANFVVLTNSRGEALSALTATTLATVQENVYLLRPVAGSGVSAITVRLLMR